MGPIVSLALHLTPVWAFAMAFAAALGWHAGTALWRWGARRAGRH